MKLGFLRLPRLEVQNMLQYILKIQITTAAVILKILIATAAVILKILITTAAVILQRSLTN